MLPNAFPTSAALLLRRLVVVFGDRRLWVRFNVRGSDDLTVYCIAIDSDLCHGFILWGFAPVDFGEVVPSGWCLDHLPEGAILSPLTQKFSLFNDER